MPRILLTGATGFVGGYLYPALRAAGHEVRCAARDPERARRHHPQRDWVGLDLHDPASVPAALAGCDAAFYLVHGLEEGAGYADRERRAAESFWRRARAAGVRRIVYLGAVVPEGTVSQHLRSRLEVGEILRQPGASTVELRSGLILGHGGKSWLMVRDLARRLPAMLLPRWLRNRSQPIAIDDAVAALVRALTLPGDASCCLDLPGPEVLTHRDLLRRTAAAFGRRPPMIDVPVLTPQLSCYWIFWFTRASREMARELVQSLTCDLVSAGPGVFASMPDHRRLEVDAAIRRALADEAEADGHALAPGAIRRMQALGRHAATA
jgi:uncharacterized protein YbjT (DUF2867 family)